MTIQAPMTWAGRSLRACEVGGDPFVVAFDAQAQATCTDAQGRYLLQMSGLDLHPVDPPVPPSVPKPSSPKKSVPPKPKEA